MLCKKLATLFAAGALLASTAHTVRADDNGPITMGVVSFLSGAMAGALGVPSKNGAELVIDAINKGQLPAPYNTKGLGGREIVPVYVDESGGNTRQATEFRNLVERRNAKIVVGYISSGSCLAIAPIAEELKVLTVMSTCGTPRIFEDSNHHYLFRTRAHSLSDGVAAARYILDEVPNVKEFTGINQNYSWGTDSWRDFVGAMKALAPGIKVSDKAQWPKFLAGQYGTEISVLLSDPSQVVYSSFFGGDLEALVLQGAARGLFARKKVAMLAGAGIYDRLGKQFPDGVIVGETGPYGMLVRTRDTVLNKWFISEYRKRYGSYPNYGSYHYAQSVLAVKAAYDRAAAKQAAPSIEQVVDAMTGLKFESFSTTVDFALGKGHQAITEHGYGVTKFDKSKNEPAVVDIKFYPASCVNPPEGITAEKWLEQGMPGAKC